MSSFTSVPRPRFSLGLRLSLPTSLAVVVAMAALTSEQLAFDLRTELIAKRAQFALALAPLVEELETLSSAAESRDAVARFHAAFLREGRIRHLLEVIDASGRSLAANGDPTVLREDATVSVALPVKSAAFGSSSVTLVAADIDHDYAVERRRRWRAWIVHLAVTAATMQLLLYVVIRHQIARPIERLVAAVLEMQRDHLKEAADPGGAWELRWLGNRFHSFGRELSRSVEHLIAAQRRAYSQERPFETAGGGELTVEPSRQTGALSNNPDPVLTQLRQVVVKLTGATSEDSSTRHLARLAWERYAPHAEELGHPDLRRDLEDAALRILDREGWLQVARIVDVERPRLEVLARTRSERIRQGLEKRGVPWVSLTQRVKHTAGIWRKMRQKDLELPQVHDLVALRIIVPTEFDCYVALGVLQELYVPIVGRFKDYIAAPKRNGYRSLHLTLRDDNGEVFEVQIRSMAMHQHAEQGVASHALYKEEAPVQPSSGYRPRLSAAMRRLLPQWTRRD